MERTSLVILLIATILCQANGNSVFGWLWGKGSDDTTVLVADGVPLVSIPYEALTEDEKFLQEAAKFTDIQVSSPLETCQHKVVMKIKTSCSDMTEEELAKLSVNLLNCQSAVEGRKMFPCTDEMSLKQCTTDMDADMWNAYHLMSNRARAVCYATRGTQFRALTELTVNKLMQTAHTQIKTLGSLKESQDRLEEQTVEALSSLSEGNKALLQQQQHLKDAQTSAHKLVTTNLRELNNEKALIRSGHIQLAEMAADIKKKLEEASQQLQQQAAKHGEHHQEILQDLMNIQEQAQLIWDKIETSTDRIFAQHNEALAQYEHTLHKLTQINDTIQYIWNVVNTMRAEIDEKLNWLTNYIDNTGERMQDVSRTGLHIIYLLVAMIVAAFLHAPFATRLSIMGIVPLNLLTYFKYGMEDCLDFHSMTLLILLITAMHFIMAGIQHVCGPKLNKVNGAGQDYVSSSYSNLDPKESLFTKLKNRTLSFYRYSCYQINSCIRTCTSLVQLAASWSRQSLTQREELSCSYIASKKNHEDLIPNYEREFPSMSEDMTDFENSHIMIDDRSEDNFDNLFDAYKAKRRFRVENSVSKVSYSHRSPSRSVSPSNSMIRYHCNAITRSGRKCRLYSRTDSNCCSRHMEHPSIIED